MAQENLKTPQNQKSLKEIILNKQNYQRLYHFTFNHQQQHKQKCGRLKELKKTEGTKRNGCRAVITKNLFNNYT